MMVNGALSLERGRVYKALTHKWLSIREQMGWAEWGYWSTDIKQGTIIWYLRSCICSWILRDLPCRSASARCRWEFCFSKSMQKNSSSATAAIFSFSWELWNELCEVSEESESHCSTLSCLSSSWRRTFSLEFSIRTCAVSSSTDASSLCRSWTMCILSSRLLTLLSWFRFRSTSCKFSGCFAQNRPLTQQVAHLRLGPPFA